MAGSQLPAPLEVRVLAADGSPLPRVVLYFLGDGDPQPVNPSDTAFSSREVYTDADGRAVMGYRFPTLYSRFPLETGAFVYHITDNLTGFGAHWWVFIVSAPAAQLRILAGNDQAGTPGQPLGVALQVQVTDEFGNSVGGQPVVWTVTSGAGSLAQSTTVSAGNGVAENIWTLGPSPGEQTVSAAAGELIVVFSATAGSGS